MRGLAVQMFSPRATPRAGPGVGRGPGAGVRAPRTWPARGAPPPRRNRSATARAVSGVSGAGFNTVDYIQTEGRFTHYNLLGGARRFDATVTLGNLLAGQMNGSGIFRKVIVDSTITGDGDA